MNNDNINKEYGKILQNFRQKNHFTQEKVSELTGLDPKYISQIERGELKGSIKTLLNFCNAYKVTPNDVLLNFLNYTPNTNNYDSRINSLSLRDKEMIDSLLEFLSKNEKYSKYQKNA